MKRAIVRWLTAAVCGLLAACAIITVNVYFPEKDVKEAYKSLDDMLLKEGDDAKKPVEEPPAEPEKKDVPKPQSSILDGRFGFSLVAAAYAQDKVADELAIELSSMPDVLKAYDDIRAVLPQLDALRESGAIGENKQGLLTVRDKAKLGGNEALVKKVNDSRKIIVTGMAKALEKIGKRKEPGSKANFNELMARAAATFASLRHDEAKPGWWLELPNGRWVQK